MTGNDWEPARHIMWGNWPGNRPGLGTGAAVPAVLPLGGYLRLVEWAGRLALLGPGGQIDETACPNVEPPTYRRIYELFAGALASGRAEDVPVPASQARDVLRIIEAARESGKAGKEILL